MVIQAFAIFADPAQQCPRTCLAKKSRDLLCDEPYSSCVLFPIKWDNFTECRRLYDIHFVECLL